MKSILVVLCVLCAISGFSQTTIDSGNTQITNDPGYATLKKDRYTVSGGVLGNANFSRFRVTNASGDDLKYKYDFGYGAGVWLSIPLGRVVSLEAEGVYNSYKYAPKTSTHSPTMFRGDIKYWSIPVLLKFHLGEAVAITAGPQFDIINSVEDEIGVFNKQSFKKSSIALNASIELFPRSRVSFFGRYIHGFDNLDEDGNPGTVTEAYNQNIQAGLKLKLFGRKILADTDGDSIPDKNDKCPTQAGLARYEGCPIPDTDKDGINDEVDKCPTVAGLAQFSGCADTDGDGISDDQDKCPDKAGEAKYNGCPPPDADGDGVNDEVDKCPNQAGVAKYNGCPVPDSDGDSFNDEVDKCPGVAGVKEYQGCPIPDTDKDGILDTEDKCPTIAGVKENDGCPAIPKFNATNIQFVTGSAKLTSGALTELNDIVTYLKEYTEIKLQINGHTDNVGKEEMNQILSEKRAQAVLDALIKKGVDASRLGSAGFGMTTPLVDNKTSKGRAQNRRVEFKFNQ